MQFENPFVFSRIPEIHFGVGTLSRLPGLLRSHGSSVLLVTGAASFRKSSGFEALAQSLREAGLHFEVESFSGEPSPDFVDAVAAAYRTRCPDSVVSIGGGSAIDAGKAISAMLLQTGSVRDFLEGQETRRHDGRKVPFVAVPTSSGTGAEATKNAVLSELGREGFKNSLRHDNFMPNAALVDPLLMRGCPPSVTAACGLDALTQLLEAYVSSKASPLTDALALSGLRSIAQGFVRACEHGEDIEARSHMAYAALLSGLVLANAGLGLVHGFAGPIGGRCAMPHGEVCGTLLGEVTQRTIAALSEEAAGPHRVALEKYARVGVLLSGQPARSAAEDAEALVDVLTGWIERFQIPRLGRYGLTVEDFGPILDRSNGKNSPVTLGRAEMDAILRARC